MLLTTAGPGTTILGNAGNSYSGGTVIGGGTLTLGAAGALGPTTNSLTMAGGVLDLSGQAATVGTLSGTVGTITNNATVATAASLTVNNSGTSDLRRHDRRRRPFRQYRGAERAGPAARWC